MLASSNESMKLGHRSAIHSNQMTENFRKALLESQPRRQIIFAERVFASFQIDRDHFVGVFGHQFFLDRFQKLGDPPVLFASRKTLRQCDGLWHGEFSE